MAKGIAANWESVGHLLKRPAVAYALAKAGMEHRRIEKEFRRRLLRVCPSEATLEFPHIGLTRNFRASESQWSRSLFS